MIAKDSTERLSAVALSIGLIIIAIVSVFVLCWLPYNTNHLIIEYQDRSAHFSCSFQIYFAVTYFMINAYCAINLIICFMFSSNYRQGIKRLIKCSFAQA